MNSYIFAGLNKPERNKSIRNPDLSELLNQVIRVTGIPLENIMSKSRKREFVYPRHIFCYIANRTNRFTQQEMVEKLNRVNHATAINGITKIKGFLDYDKSVIADINEFDNFKTV